MKNLTKYSLPVVILLVIFLYKSGTAYANGYCFDCTIGYQTCDGAYPAGPGPGGSIPPDTLFDDPAVSPSASQRTNQSINTNQHKETINTYSPKEIEDNLNAFIMETIKFLSFGQFDLSK